MTEKLDLQPSIEALKVEFPSLIIKYLTLPNYFDVPGLKEQQDAIQAIQNPEAEAYYDYYRSNAWAAVQNKDYKQACSLAETSLNLLPQQKFSDHDQKAVKIFMLRRLGKIYEHWATYGEKKTPFNSERITTHFLRAAYFYIQGDMEMKGTTEFAGRAAESFLGAGLQPMGLFLLHYFYGDNIQVDPSTETIASFISTSRKVGEQKTGGVWGTFWGKGK